MDNSFDKHASKLDVPEITGYYLYSKSPKGEWEERHIQSPETFFKYNNLLCGNQYQILISDFFRGSQFYFLLQRKKRNQLSL
ncbi:hypothetical protein BLA29_012962 [Euroglyphus maynei]|uniref:Fibronectin type-III domain-containing protein n=1 Tax=Euroglyphus maynei TaxID=6958 RepID=A0A1Y3AKT4_EURMA|nr:hypothetical protein BLA29_012962 [Euroglyphus maynei]